MRGQAATALLAACDAARDSVRYAFATSLGFPAASAAAAASTASRTATSIRSRPYARRDSLIPIRRASSRITWSDGIRSPRSIREMYAALHPGNASSRWLIPAASRAVCSRCPTATGSS